MKGNRMIPSYRRTAVALRIFVKKKIQIWIVSCAQLNMARVQWPLHVPRSSWNNCRVYLESDSVRWRLDRQTLQSVKHRTWFHCIRSFSTNWKWQKKKQKTEMENASRPIGFERRKRWQMKTKAVTLSVRRTKKEIWFETFRRLLSRLKLSFILHSISIWIGEWCNAGNKKMPITSCGFYLKFFDKISKSVYLRFRFDAFSPMTIPYKTSHEMGSSIHCQSSIQ